MRIPQGWGLQEHQAWLQQAGSTEGSQQTEKGDLVKYEQALRILRGEDEGGDTPFFYTPTVCTAYWDERDWVAHIWGEDVEGLPPRNSYHLGPYRRDPERG